MQTQYGFYFDASRCVGCKTCILACKSFKNLTADLYFRTVVEYGGGTWTEVANGAWDTNARMYYLSLSCNHCSMPLCKAICPTNAIYKDADTGSILVNAELCDGCGQCEEVCPYQAVHVEIGQKLALKCNLCQDRLIAGQAPICVESCPTRALECDDIQVLRKKYGKLDDLAPLPSSDATRPNLVIGAPANVKKMPSGSAVQNKYD